MISYNIQFVINYNYYKVRGLSRAFCFFPPLVPDPIMSLMEATMPLESSVSLPGVTVSIWCGWQSAGCSCCYICRECSDSNQAMCLFCPATGRHCSMMIHEVEEYTCEMSITESQLKGRAEVRSLKPSSVEMIPFWSIRRIMVPSTKKMVPYLSTVMPRVEDEKKKEGNASQTLSFASNTNDVFKM